VNNGRQTEEVELRRAIGGPLWEALYDRMPIGRGRVIQRILRVEGGQMRSATLRSILARRYEVYVQAYSYGSLLVPGNADRGTYIGRYVSIGGNVRRLGADHPIDRVGLHPFAYNPALGLVPAASDVSRSEIHIGHDSWIGENVLILSRVRRIGIGAIVGAGSIVTRDVEDFSIVVGSPARHIRYRLSAAKIAEVRDLAPWERTPQEYAAIVSSFGPARA
jgi:virginiamycin A acetyltransferase